MQHTEPDVADARTHSPLDLRSISRAAVVTALALALPPVFHALHLGHVFLPMYLPILAGAFLLRPGWAVAVGVSAPIVSAVATGMPPLMPPIAVWMAVELGVMGGLAASLHRRLRWSVWLIVATVLVVGRIIYLGLVFGSAGWLGLPPRLLTLTSLAGGWPGMILALLVVPAAIRLTQRWGVTP